MIVKEYAPDDLLKLDLQSGQAIFKEFTGDKSYAKWLMSGDSYSLFEGDRLLCCAGVIEIWGGRAHGWAFISEQVDGADLLKITRAAKRLFDASPYQRIETTVDIGFTQGHRWAKLLGMEYEGTHKKYSPDGIDVCMYARIK